MSAGVSSETLNRPSTTVIDESSPRQIRWLAPIFIVFYIVGCCRLAAAVPLWMDEVLSVWVIRMKTTGDIVSALMHGSEFASPTYHLLLHYWGSLVGYSYLALRLPSILATAGAVWCVYLLLQRYLNSNAATFGLAFSALGILGDFAVQVRPYALVVACFSLALLYWSDLTDSPAAMRRRDWRHAAIAALLAFAIALHFYAVLSVVALGCIELLWVVIYRRIRPGIWLALLAAGGSILFWLPMIRVLSRYNAGDSSSVEYYAHPTVAKLISTYVYLVSYGLMPGAAQRTALFLFAVIAFAVLAWWLRGLRQIESPKVLTPLRPAPSFFVILFSLLAFPVVVLVFARLVTHTYNHRYVLIASIGLAFLLSFVFSGLLQVRLAAVVTLLTASMLAQVPVGAHAGFERELAKLLDKAPEPGPIVIGEALHFLELKECSSASAANRLAYLTDVPGAPAPDPTNENQVKRWHTIDPSLQVEPALRFLAAHPNFYVFHTTTTIDTLTPWLLSQGALLKPVANVGDAWLLKAKAP